MNNSNAKRKGKLLKLTILRFVWITLILVFGICIIVSHLIRKENLKIYEAFSRSYSRMVAKNVDADRIPGYLMTGETDEYYMQIDALLNSMVDVSDLRYLYIYIPQEDGIRYLWDAQSDDDSRPLLDVWYYSGNFPKEEAFETYAGGGEHFCVYQYDVINLAAYMTPLYDRSGKVVAVCEADIIMPRIEMVFPNVLIHILTWVMIILLLSMALFMYSTRKRIITPLEKINDAALGIVDNLESTENIELDVHTNDEIETLARSIEKMNRKLKDYLHENEQITAEKERVKTELDLAARIQADMLPNIFPAFPDRPEFNIYATMTPAKEVGGDFYDFFLVGEDHLAIVMADVSGKGVPAAMFMMMAKSMLQSQLISGKDPARVLQDVNKLIFADNKENMFVTVWVGILDINTGVLVASNGGHEYPIFREPGGAFEIIKDKHGFVIGGRKNMKYTNYEMVMKPGSRLFLYTDGVPEAANMDRKRFGMERTLAAVNIAPDASVEEILANVDSEVKKFAGEAEQFDDLTMLCLEYSGSQYTAPEGVTEHKEIKVEAEVENLRPVMDFLNGELKALNCPDKIRRQIDVAVDEIYGNIAFYAYGDDTGDITVKMEIPADRSYVVIRFIDSGVPFNPLNSKDPNLSLSARERPKGGLGIYLVKNTMDDMTYEYKDGKNILSIKKSLK